MTSSDLEQIKCLTKLACPRVHVYVWFFPVRAVKVSKILYDTGPKNRFPSAAEPGPRAILALPAVKRARDVDLLPPTSDIPPCLPDSLSSSSRPYLFAPLVIAKYPIQSIGSREASRQDDSEIMSHLALRNR